MGMKKSRVGTGRDNEKEEVKGGNRAGIMRRRKSRVGTGRGQ